MLLLDPVAAVRALLSILVAVSGLVSLRFAAVDCIIFDEVQSLNVWLTVSSLASKDPNNKSNFLFRQIELNWINAPLNDDGDYIALYLDSEPDAPGGASPVSVHRPSTISGKLLVPDYYLPVIDFYNETLQSTSSWQDTVDSTNSPEWTPGGQLRVDSSFQPAQLSANKWNQYRSYATPDIGSEHSHRTSDAGGGRQDWPAPDQVGETQFSLVDECVGYCVAYHSQRRILAKSCLRTHPTWMQDSQIGSRSLTTIAVAGTHNSGTYQKQRPGSHKIDKSVLQLINKYQLNQEESIFNQLVYGIRYLDLRVGFSKVKHRSEELWIYHDIFRTDNSLDEVLRQIRRFLDLTKGEIVIVDFHRFTVGFQNEDPQTELEHHGKVLELLFKTLGDYIVPSYLGQNAPLNEYVGLNKRLFVGYAGRSRLLNLQAAEEGSTTQHHPIQFGANFHTSYQQAAQQVRDVDADKQEDGSAHTGPPTIIYPEDHEDPSREMLDRRIGTRVYNRLKSLKLISHSFSKRSIEEHKDEKHGHKKLTSTAKRGNIYKSKQQHLPTPDRSMKIITQSAPISSTVPQSFNSKLSLLFNPVHHVWPNTDKEESLKHFMEQSTCRKYFGELNSLMAELTPTVFGAISDKYDGIRRLSSLTNRMVGDLIRSKFLHCINLIATDFFLGNDLIRLAIHANKMRLHHRNTDLDPLQGGCKSFRHIRPLLEKSRFLDTNAIQSSSATTSPNSFQADGISDLITSFFKRIFNR